MSRPVDRGSSRLAFAEQLLTILADGAFTATYKYAVLLALVDLCVEYSTSTGDAPTSVTTPQLAEKVLELYWPQARVYQDSATTYPTRSRSHNPTTLRQNSGGQATIVSQIVRFQNGHGEPGKSFARARSLKGFDRLVRHAEWTLVEKPLPRLQRVGTEQMPFLYEIDWDDSVLRSTFHSGSIRKNLRFIGRSGDDLVRLAPFVRPIVQRQWAALVARINELPEASLEDFLFGSRREALGHLAKPLLQLQDDECFYCRKRINSNREVDHFVPWSRYPDDRLDNLVVTHGSCNRHKSDHLAAAEHVERWMERTRDCKDEMGEIASSTQWQHEPARTLAVVRSMYLRLPTGARLWRIQAQFVAANRTQLQSMLEL